MLIFVFQESSSWAHVSGQNVSLQNSTLLHLLEIERVYLQKQAQVSILENAPMMCVCVYVLCYLQKQA